MAFVIAFICMQSSREIVIGNKQGHLHLNKSTLNTKLAF